MIAWRQWRRFWEAAGASGEARTTFDRLAACYGEPVRAYHTLRHVMACLAELSAVRDLCSQPLAVELAFWFHDAVYNPGTADNEARSASLLREEGRRMGISGELCRAAEKLVLATAHLGEQAEPAGDEALVRDIDLAVLGKSWRRFDAYERAVRQEYASLSQEEFRVGRRDILESFLRRPSIYATDRFRDRCEAKARANLSRAVERLRRPAGAAPATPPPR